MSAYSIDTGSVTNSSIKSAPSFLQKPRKSGWFRKLGIVLICAPALVFGSASSSSNHTDTTFANPDLLHSEDSLTFNDPKTIYSTINRASKDLSKSEIDNIIRLLYDSFNNNSSIIKGKDNDEMMGHICELCKDALFFDHIFYLAVNFQSIKEIKWPISNTKYFYLCENLCVEYIKRLDEKITEAKTSSLSYKIPFSYHLQCLSNSLPISMFLREGAFYLKNRIKKIQMSFKFKNKISKTVNKFNNLNTVEQTYFNPIVTYIEKMLAKTRDLDLEYRLHKNRRKK